jgi:hypothetical protein
MALLDIVVVDDLHASLNRGDTSISGILTNSETEVAATLNRGNVGTINNVEADTDAYVAITNLMPTAANVKYGAQFGQQGTQYTGTLIVPGQASGAVVLTKETGANARGGSGNCAKFVPSSTTSEGYWHFFVPADSGTPFTLTLWHKIASGFNGSLAFFIYDIDQTTILRNGSITLTDDGTYHQFTSLSATASSTGLCLVRIVFTQGTHGSNDAIYIDDVTIG